jgi:uncharacterized OB-fold protein
MICKKCNNTLTKSELKNHQKLQPPKEICTECQLRDLGWVDNKVVSLEKS